MLLEAVGMVVVDDTEAGRDPEDRRAPKAEWDHLWSVMKRAEKRPASEPLPPDDSTISAFVAQLVFVARRTDAFGAKERKTARRKQAAPQMPLALTVYQQPAHRAAQ